MSIYGTQTTVLDTTDPYHANNVIGEASTSEGDTSDPYTTYGYWKYLLTPYAGSSIHHSTAEQWPKRMTARGPEDGTETGIWYSPGQTESLHEYQTRHESAMSCVEHSSPAYQGSLVPFTSPEERLWLPKGSGPSPKVCPKEPLLRGKEGLHDELASSPDCISVAIGPRKDPGTVSGQGYSSVLESPWPSSEEDLLKSPEHVLIQFGETSPAAAKTPSSIDVGSEGVHWHHDRPTRPGGNLSVDSLSPGVKSVGSATAMPIFNPRDLVGAQTEHRPSHAYPRRQGTVYVPPRRKGGPMTDTITASAPVTGASPAWNVPSLSSAQSCRSYTSFDDSGFACSLSSSSTHASPPLESTVSSRRASTSALPEEDSDVPGYLECVWDSCMNLVEPRKRRQFSATERAETRTVRANGACERCRKSKRRVMLLCATLYC